MPRDYHLARGHILEAMPGTVPELVKKSGYVRCTVNRWLEQLRQGTPAERAAHIGDWFVPEGRGPVVAIWHAGPGRHASRPRRKTSNAERWKKAKEKHGLPKLNAKWLNQHYVRQRRKGRTDPLLDAFRPKPCHNENT